MMRRVGAGVLPALILLVVAAALAWSIADDLSRPSDGAASAAVAASLATALPELPDADGRPMISPEALSEIAERPVFSASRRPPTGDVSSPAPQPSQRRTIDFELTGVVTTGDRRLALVMPRGSNETVQLREGETYRGWTVTEITDDYVALRTTGFEEDIHLSYKPQQSR